MGRLADWAGHSLGERVAASDDQINIPSERILKEFKLQAHRQRRRAIKQSLIQLDDGE